MAALFILPLLLIFTFLDFGGSDTEEADLDVPPDTPDTPDAGTADVSPVDTNLDLSPGLLADIGTSSTTDANDEVRGNEGINVIDGQGGNDRLLGFGSTDYLEGGLGNDVLRGGDGNDVLGGSAGNDKLDGGADRDLLMGGAGDDLLQGGAGDDVLFGGSGGDQLIGGDGNDWLFSYAEDFHGAADDDERVTDFNVEHILAFDLLASENPEASFEELEAYLSQIGQGHEDLAQTAPDESSDRLEGGAGNDVLFLGSGDDGFGGSGADEFVVNAGNEGAAAVIWDFSAAQDLVVVDYEGEAEPAITVEDVDDNSHVSADGVLLAVVLNTEGALSAEDVRLVRSA